jgi:hypothetical protein
VADQRDELSLADGQVDPLQGDEIALLGLEGHADVLDAQVSVHGALPLSGN